MQSKNSKLESAKMKSYRDLEIYKLAKANAIKIHQITLHDLPKFETFEEASRLRRCSKSVVSNIIEGYGRKRYKNEFVQFLTYALASCDETKGHLELLFETGSLSQKLFQDLYSRYKELGAKLYSFREAVLKRHNEF